MKNILKRILFSLIVLGSSYILSAQQCVPPTCTVGMSSYYGKKFAGKKTASGDVFNPNEMTAAHRTYKFGTKLKVTNPLNNKSVIVTVNDRGPFIKGRELDLSRAAFEKIADIRKGVLKVTVEIIK